MTLRLGLGPVFAYEWLRATRRWTMYAWRAGFVLVLLGGLALAWQVWLVESHRTASSTVQAQADLAKMFFGIIECVAVITVLLAAPAATAGVICQERARGALLDVLATDVSSAEVVLGKLAARLLPVLATIAAALPVLAITGLFGGIDPGALVGSFAVIVGLAVLGCALALSLSLWGRKTHEVLLAMYFVWLGWLLLLPGWVAVTSHLAGRPLPSGWLVRASPRSYASWPVRWCSRPGWSRSPSGGCAPCALARAARGRHHAPALPAGAARGRPRSTATPSSGASAAANPRRAGRGSFGASTAC
jgi:ABC-type transport system involved in multi-copper enzyme maturation permease subunit